MSDETLEFINTLYEREKAKTPMIDYLSFVAGAKATIESLISRL